MNDLKLKIQLMGSQKCHQVVNGIKFIPIDKSKITVSHFLYAQVYSLIIIDWLL
jgi:hypothetical protein